MKIFSHVLKNTIIYFVCSICIAVTIIGSLGYYLFNKNYRQEIDQIYTMTFNEVYTELQNDIVLETSNIYFDIISHSSKQLDFFYKNSIKDHPYKVNNIRDALTEYTTIYPNITDVSIYYPKDNIIISRYSGLIYCDSNKKFTDKVNLMQQYLTPDSNFKWIFSGFNHYNMESKLILVGSFSSQIRDSLVTVEVATNAINRVLTNFSTENLSFYLLDAQQNTIFPSNVAVNLDRSIVELDKQPQAKIINKKIDNKNSSIIYQYVEYLDAYLVLQSSTDQFYIKSNFIRNMMLLVCGFSITISILCASMFAKKLYRPIKKIVETSDIFSNQLNLINTPTTNNEYDYIDFMLNSLTFKLSSLQDTLSSNKQLIKFGIMMQLLHNTYNNERYLRERFELLSMSMSGPYFRVLSLKFPTFSTSLPAEQYEYVFYETTRLINNLSMEHPDHFALHAVKMAESNIVMVADCKEAALSFIIDIANVIKQICVDNFAVTPYIYISNFTSNFLDIHFLYDEILLLEHYTFVMPNKAIITSDCIVQDVVSSNHYNDLFTDALNSRSIEKVRECLNLLLSDSHSGMFSYQQCNQILITIINCLARYIKALNLTIDKDIYKEFLTCDNVDQFCSWILTIVENCFHMANAHSTIKSSGTIKDIIEYITTNLDKDYNLNTVANHFSLSPNYLSRIFKEQTGVTFIEFVNNYRLEQAATLVARTTLNIEDISNKTGFNSSAYFIKKFKEKYGLTPKNYRIVNSR